MTRFANSSFSSYFAAAVISIWSTGMLFAATAVPASAAFGA